MQRYQCKLFFKVKSIKVPLLCIPKEVYVTVHAIKIKLHILTSTEAPETTPWYRQDSKDLDKPMKA